MSHFTPPTCFTFSRIAHHRGVGCACRYGAAIAFPRLRYASNHTKLAVYLSIVSVLAAAMAMVWTASHTIDTMRGAWPHSGTPGPSVTLPFMLIDGHTLHVPQVIVAGSATLRNLTMSAPPGGVPVLVFPDVAALKEVVALIAAVGLPERLVYDTSSFHNQALLRAAEYLQARQLQALPDDYAWCEEAVGGGGVDGDGEESGCSGFGSGDGGSASAGTCGGGEGVGWANQQVVGAMVSDLLRNSLRYRADPHRSAAMFDVSSSGRDIVRRGGWNDVHVGIVVGPPVVAGERVAVEVEVGWVHDNRIMFGAQPSSVTRATTADNFAGSDGRGVVWNGYDATVRHNRRVEPTRGKQVNGRKVWILVDRTRDVDTVWVRVFKGGKPVMPATSFTCTGSVDIVVDVKHAKGFFTLRPVSLAEVDAAAST